MMPEFSTEVNSSRLLENVKNPNDPTAIYKIVIIEFPEKNILLTLSFI